MADLADKREESIEEVNEKPSNIAADLHFILQMQNYMNEPRRFTTKFFNFLLTNFCSHVNEEVQITVTRSEITTRNILFSCRWDDFTKHSCSAFCVLVGIS